MERFSSEEVRRLDSQEATKKIEGASAARLTSLKPDSSDRLAIYSG